MNSDFKQYTYIYNCNQFALKYCAQDCIRHNLATIVIKAVKLYTLIDPYFLLSLLLNTLIASLNLNDSIGGPLRLIFINFSTFFKDNLLRSLL